MKFLLFVISLLAFQTASAVEGSFTINTIGSSNNSNTIFIETAESITGSECPNKYLFRLPDSDKAADRLFSMGLAEKTIGKKIVINYEVDSCFEGASLVRAFRLRD